MMEPGTRGQFPAPGMLHDEPAREREVLEFWRDAKIFERSLEQTKDGERYTIFEGPPTANGRPGVHHVLARAFKDLYPRFWTMRGRFVRTPPPGLPARPPARPAQCRSGWRRGAEQ